MGESWRSRIRAALVVDDNPAIVRTLVAGIESRTGATAFGATTIALARAALRTLRPDACVIDMQLPDGSGLDLIRELRATHPGTRILLLTGLGSMDVGAEAIRAGADQVVAKPATLSEIMARLYGERVARSSQSPTAERALWEHMQRVLHDCGGNKSMAARKLGVDRGTLQRWLDREAPRR